MNSKSYNTTKEMLKRKNTKSSYKKKNRRRQETQAKQNCIAEPNELRPLDEIQF